MVTLLKSAKEYRKKMQCTVRNWKMLKHRKKSVCGGKSIEFILGQSNLFICTCIRGLFKVKELGKNVFYSHQKNEYLGKYAEFGVFILGNLKLFFYSYPHTFLSFSIFFFSCFKIFWHCCWILLCQHHKKSD